MPITKGGMREVETAPPTAAEAVPRPAPRAADAVPPRAADATAALLESVAKLLDTAASIEAGSIGATSRPSPPAALAPREASDPVAVTGSGHRGPVVPTIRSLVTTAVALGLLLGLVEPVLPHGQRPTLTAPASAAPTPAP